MDAEKTIAEIEWLERFFAVPDTRPLSARTLSVRFRFEVRRSVRSVSQPMKQKTWALIPAALLIFATALSAQWLAGQATASGGDDPDARPPVTKADIQIVQRARQILNSQSKWNRADTRVCPTAAKTFSLYCALEKATDEVSGKFEHRSAAMQEARFVIDEIAPNRKNYKHRLMDYNNDPTTTFADIKKFFRLLEDRITERLTEESQGRN
jgi:hypothetical protein